jgi:hypothetical protein
MVYLRVKVSRPTGEAEEPFYGPPDLKGTPLETAVEILLGRTHSFDITTGVAILDQLTGEAVLVDETGDPPTARELGRWPVAELLYHVRAEYGTRRHNIRHSPGDN